jgi:demethylmenaquinone methyltransferase/2-methoxy-6-polyprenyl-1,4-benzoquinol methylase
MAREVLRRNQHIQVAAADFTLQMMLVGRQHGVLPFTAADALQLPFADAAFDGIVSGFLMRNVGNLDQALQEQWRTLKAGGTLVILETTRPQKNLFSPLIWLHMHLMIPLLGGAVSGFREAYQYLPNSSEQFLTAEEFSGKLQQAGFVDVGFHRRMFGTIALHWGKKR